MDKAERQQITARKFRQRLVNHRIDTTRPGNYYNFKTSGKPCSCFMCSPLKYKRNQKHRALLSAID